MTAPGPDGGGQPSWIELDDEFDAGEALAELQDIMVDQLGRVTDLLARLKPEVEEPEVEELGGAAAKGKRTMQ